MSYMESMNKMPLVIGSNVCAMLWFVVLLCRYYVA
jgi:hypothetical protein